MNIIWFVWTKFREGAQKRKPVKNVKRGEEIDDAIKY